MNKFVSIVPLISTVLLQSTLAAAEAETILHIHINDEINSSVFDGYEMNFTEDNNVSTIESSKVSGKAIVDAVNNDSINISDNNEVNKEGLRTSVILIPILAVFCIYALTSFGLLIKNKYKKDTKPKRRSLHFEDDDELSKILVQTPAATAIGSDAFTVRSIHNESSITKSLTGKYGSKKDVAFLPINHAYKVTLPWNPKHLDEIKLKVGDIVCIKKCYSDGYSFGRNVTTRVDGIFPTCCLSSMEESIDQAAIEKWVNSGMITTKKRTTSLFLNDINYKI